MVISGAVSRVITSGPAQKETIYRVSINLDSGGRSSLKGKRRKKEKKGLKKRKKRKERKERKKRRRKQQQQKIK